MLELEVNVPIEATERRSHSTCHCHYLLFSEVGEAMQGHYVSGVILSQRRISSVHTQLVYEDQSWRLRRTDLAPCLRI